MNSRSPVQTFLEATAGVIMLLTSFRTSDPAQSDRPPAKIFTLSEAVDFALANPVVQAVPRRAAAARCSVSKQRRRDIW